MGAAGIENDLKEGGMGEEDLDGKDGKKDLDVISALGTVELELD